MDKSFINGYEIIINKYGYWPSFHDDIIDRLEITNDKIVFYINMQSYHDDDKPHSIIKLSLCEIEKFSLEGELYGCVSIILDLEFHNINNIIETQISSSLGTRGIIYSKKVNVDLIFS